jgi:hypothetical protein
MDRPRPTTPTQHPAPITPGPRSRTHLNTPTPEATLWVAAARQVALTGVAHHQRTDVHLPPALPDHIRHRRNHAPSGVAHYQRTRRSCHHTPEPPEPIAPPAPPHPGPVHPTRTAAPAHRQCQLGHRPHLPTSATPPHPTPIHARSQRHCSPPAHSTLLPPHPRAARADRPASTATPRTGAPHAPSGAANHQRPTRRRRHLPTSATPPHPDRYTPSTQRRCQPSAPNSAPTAPLHQRYLTTPDTDTPPAQRRCSPPAPRPGAGRTPPQLPEPGAGAPRHHGHPTTRHQRTPTLRLKWRWATTLTTAHHLRSHRS